MTCKDLEADIYLYSELSGAEQKRVDAHVHECKACRELFELAKATQVLTTHVATVKHEPANHSRLTGNIMQAIASKPAKASSWIYIPFFKYAMMAASLALIVLFGAEQMQQRGFPKRMPVAGSVVLESASISETFLKRKDKSENKPSLYACAKSGACDNVFIKNFVKKSF